jgi:hypothetical protein
MGDVICLALNVARNKMVVTFVVEDHMHLLSAEATDVWAKHDCIGCVPGEGLHVFFTADRSMLVSSKEDRAVNTDAKKNGKHLTDVGMSLR